MRYKEILPAQHLNGEFRNLNDAPNDEDVKYKLTDNSSDSRIGPNSFNESPSDVEVVYHLDSYVDTDKFNLKKGAKTVSTNDGDGERQDDASLALEIAEQLASKYDFRNDDSGLYVYNDKSGRYELLSKSGDYSGSIAYFIMNNSCYQSKLKTTLFRLVYSWLRNSRQLSKPMPKVAPQKVCLRNGVYDLQDSSFCSHHKKFGFKTALNAYYEPKAKLNSISKQYFWRLGGGDEGARLILAALGIIISNYRKLGKAIFLYGPRSNGKSTLAELIRQVLPEKSVRGLSMSDFGNQFAIANLKDAHVTICTDLPAGSWSKAAIGKFKQTVTCDFFEAGAKGVQQDTIKPRAFVVFISNFLPKIPQSQDPEGAVQRRIWPIQTGESVPADQVDPNILEKLMDDIDAIVSVALQEASALLGNDNRLARITSANDEIYEFKPTLLEDCLADFVDNAEIFPYTGIEEDTAELSAVFSAFIQRYQGSCSEVNNLRLNGFAVHFRKAIQKVGGCVKKLNNKSTVVGYKLLNVNNRNYSESLKDEGEDCVL